MIHTPKLSAFVAEPNALSNDDANPAFFDDLDELYEAARAMMAHWESARLLRDQYNARVLDEVAGDVVFTSAQRAEHLRRAHEAVDATVHAFDVFMQQVAYGPDAEVDRGNDSV